MMAWRTAGSRTDQGRQRLHGGLPDVVVSSLSCRDDGLAHGRIATDQGRQRLHGGLPHVIVLIVEFRDDGVRARPDPCSPGSPAPAPRPAARHMYSSSSLAMMAWRTAVPLLTRPASARTAGLPDVIPLIVEFLDDGLAHGGSLLTRPASAWTAACRTCIALIGEFRDDGLAQGRIAY